MPRAEYTDDFNPRSPCGERPARSRRFLLMFQFQSTLPVWGATPVRLPAVSPVRFQSTLPVWGATPCSRPRPGWRRYFNPRSPCGERPGQEPPGAEDRQISIHAPRVGSDAFRPGGDQAPAPISIHAPRVGSDDSNRRTHTTIGISIHAPRVGSDPCRGTICRVQMQFQSTLPVWGATGGPTGAGPGGHISIHAPRVGSDLGADGLIAAVGISIHAPRVGSDLNHRAEIESMMSNFNPRSPCGERRAAL